MDSLDVDVLVIGSGAGALTAAITAHEAGGNVLVVEKSDMYGGTSATSGGGIWIPCNHLMAEHGESDTPEAALEYLKACIGDDVSEERLAGYVEKAPEMLKFMEEKSDVKYTATPYADYLSDKPGSKEGYRTLDPLPMSATKLGKEFLKMRPPHPQTIFGGFTITVNEAKIIITRAKGWKWIMMKLMIAYRLDIPMRMKSKRHRRLCLGNALVGRCLTSVFKRKIPVWLNAPLKSLVTKDGVVTGAIITRDGKDMQINTKRGVIMAAGGFESNPDMRAKHLPTPTDAKWSAAPGTNTGDAHKAAVEAGARQVECTINGLGERAGNTALEEIVMALKVRPDIMPYATRVDTTKIMNISRRVATVSGFAVQFNKAIVGKNAFAHESGIHQDGMLKNKETFEIMRPEDVGLAGTSLPLGKHSGRAALRAKLVELGYDMADNQLADIFVRFKELADRKKEVYDDDLIAIIRQNEGEEDHVKLKSLRVVCGTQGPQTADLTLEVGGVEAATTATGDGPVDAAFNAVKALVTHEARLQLYQVSAVTEGTDAQATVSVRMEEDGRIATGQSADTDTVVASVKAYVNALNRLIVRREQSQVGYDTKGVSYKDV